MSCLPFSPALQPHASSSATYPHRLQGCQVRRQRMHVFMQFLPATKGNYRHREVVREGYAASAIEGRREIPEGSSNQREMSTGAPERKRLLGRAEAQSENPRCKRWRSR